MYGSRHLLICRPSISTHLLSTLAQFFTLFSLFQYTHVMNRERYDVAHPDTCHNKLPVCCCCIETLLSTHTSLFTVCASANHSNNFESFSFEYTVAVFDEKSGAEDKHRNSEARASIRKRQIK
jgi:hypothetical protein